MGIRKAVSYFLSVVMYLVVLLVGLGLLVLGIQLTSEGHWLVGPALAVSGLVGCRLTGKAIKRWYGNAYGDMADQS